MGEITVLVDCIRNYTEALNRHSDELKGLRQELHPLHNQIQNLFNSQLAILNEVKCQGEQTRMALSDAQSKIIAAFDEATTAVGNRIAALIAAGTDSPEFVAALQTEVDKLKAMGTAPTESNPTGGV